MLRFLCILSVIIGVKSALAPFVKPCKLDDNACMKSSAQAAVAILAVGVPELEIKAVDPMHLAHIKADQGDLQLTFKNTVVTGMKGCSVDNIKYDQVKHHMAVAIRCTVELTGDYKLGGQLIVLPVQGNGKYKINIKDIVIKTYADLVTVKDSNGKSHWHINSWRHTYNVKTNTKFYFENLFNGNKVLADPVSDFANSNWREVMQEIASPIVRPIVTEVVNAVEAFYKAVPSDEFVKE